MSSLAAFFFIFLLASVSPFVVAEKKDKLRVLFVNPATPGEQEFWDNFTLFMRAAAGDLDVFLDVKYAHFNRFQTLDLVKNSLSSRAKPDAVIYVHNIGQGNAILDVTDKAGVATFTVNTDIPISEKDQLKSPGEIYSRWVGHITPDDKQAGYDLASYLINSARGKELTDSSGKVQILALSGNKHTTVASDRNLGLLNAISEHSDVALNQLIHTDRLEENFSARVPRLFYRYPETAVFWNASDMLAISVIDGLTTIDKTPGERMLVGGMDGIDDAIDAVAKGKLTATSAGHFMDGAWALVMLYDHYHGISLNDGEREYRSKNTLITQQNLGVYKHLLRPARWESIDFKKFSKVHNKQLTTYDFGLSSPLFQ